MQYLNRYTTLPFLLNILQNRRLTLVDPARWEDENDSYFMKLYKERSRCLAILALCFTENQTSSAEKYHNWKIYAGNSSGVCIQFSRIELISCIENIKGISYRSVRYMTISKFENDQHRHKISWRLLPFIKRKAFDGETEFRIVYESNLPEDIESKDLPIELSSITKITLNPWIPESIYEAVCSTIRAIDGCKDLYITQTKILNYERWKKAVAKIAELDIVANPEDAAYRLTSVSRDEGEID